MRKFANRQSHRTEKKTKNETNTSETNKKTESDKNNFDGGVIVQTNYTLSSLSTSTSSASLGSKNITKATKGQTTIKLLSPK